MGGLSQRALIIVSLVLLTLQDLVIADSLPLALPLQSPLIMWVYIFPLNNWNCRLKFIPKFEIKRSEKKFVLRKCCAPGFIYNFNTAEVIPDEDRCVKFSVSSSHPQSRQIPWLLLGSKQNFPSSYGVQDVRIDAGFPRNCTPDEYGIVLDFLDPDKYIVDLFYVLSSGHLLVPHRFQFFEFDSYCIEDHTEDGNFKMVNIYINIWIEIYLKISNRNRRREKQFFVLRKRNTFPQLPSTIPVNWIWISWNSTTTVKLSPRNSGAGESSANAAPSTNRSTVYPLLITAGHVAGQTKVSWRHSSINSIGHLIKNYSSISIKSNAITQRAQRNSDSTLTAVCKFRISWSLLNVTV